MQWDQADSRPNVPAALAFQVLDTLGLSSEKTSLFNFDLDIPCDTECCK